MSIPATKLKERFGDSRKRRPNKLETKPSRLHRTLTMGFRPQVSGELLISLPDPGPKVDPPVAIKVELGDGEPDSGLAGRIEQALRAKLIFSAKVELVSRGVLPRTEMKARLIEYS